MNRPFVSYGIIGEPLFDKDSHTHPHPTTPKHTPAHSHRMSKANVFARPILCPFTHPRLVPSGSHPFASSGTPHSAPTGGQPVWPGSELVFRSDMNPIVKLNLSLEQIEKGGRFCAHRREVPKMKHNRSKGCWFGC